MNKEFAVREVNTYEIRTHLGPKRVEVFTKVGTHTVDIPDEVLKQSEDVDDSTQDVIVEGEGTVIAQGQDGNYYPQPVRFPFDSDVTDYQTAFERFDDALKAEVRRREEEAREAQSQVKPATEDDLKEVEKIRDGGSNDGILRP